MLESLMGIFGLNAVANYRKLAAGGAYIVDVRTKKEFANGHIHGSINIPLNELKEGIGRLDSNSIIITCCASGLRSGSARNVLQSMGYCHVYNGGSWQKLQKHIK